MAESAPTYAGRRREAGAAEAAARPVWPAALALCCFFGIGYFAVSTVPFAKGVWYEVLSDTWFFGFYLALSWALDVQRARSGRDSWIWAVGLSLGAALLLEPICWLIAAQPFTSQVEHPSPFIFVTVVEDFLVMLLWSLLHVAIRAGERAAAQQRRIAAVREAMLRDENDSLLYSLDPGFLTAALKRIGDRLDQGAKDVAGETVIVLAEHMRATLSDACAARDGDGLGAQSGRPTSSEAALREPGADRPDQARRRFRIWTATAWLVLLGAVVFAGFTAEPRPVRFVIFYGPQPVIGGLWCLAMERILARRADRRLGAVYLESAALVLAGTCLTTAGYLASMAASGHSVRPPWPAHLTQFQFAYAFPALLAWTAAYVTFEARNREISRLRAEAEIREAALKARNAMLRQQINPHFLFNALNALYALILDNKREQALGVIAAIRRFVERAGDHDEAAFVPLSAELATQDAYLDIERVRFGERLRVERRISTGLEAAQVPHLILQPLVENAVKYAVARTADPVRVEIAAERAGEALVLTVRDSGAPEAAPRLPGLGVGLANVEGRLRSLYGEAGVLACRRLSPSGFQAEVRMPFVVVAGGEAGRAYGQRR